jgi:16S rRNA U1498 N3-methylase RsmE
VTAERRWRPTGEPQPGRARCVPGAAGHYGPGSLDRLRRVAAAELDQCHRAAVPEVTGIHSWSEVPDLLAGASARGFFDTAPGARPAVEALTPPASGATGALLIGPEGG